VSRIVDRLDAWAEHSRLNPWRLLVMPHPGLSAQDRAAFDELLDATAPGARIDYRLAQPKWWFLHHAISRGLLLHGTNRLELTELRTRANGDAFGAPVTALFASDDAIWPLYFATVDRARLRHGYINWATHVRGTSRYIFSIGADPDDPASWTNGVVHLLPADTFMRTGETREFVSSEPVRPRAFLSVTPDDFPFRAQTIGHEADATPRRVAVRHALRPPRFRRTPASVRP
jgi:hypothetical protein